jgi:hypothetical protein
VAKKQQQQRDFFYPTPQHRWVSLNLISDKYASPVQMLFLSRLQSVKEGRTLTQKRALSCCCFSHFFLCLSKLLHHADDARSLVLREIAFVWRAL